MGFSSKKFKFSLDGLFTIAGTAVVLFSYVGIIPPQYQGFYCDDPKLNFIYKGDSLPLATIIGITVSVPFFVILLVEWFRHNPPNKINTNCAFSAAHRRSLFWKCCLLMYRTYFNGLICSLIIVEFLKIGIGGLRPHFFDSCRPDFSKINCSEGFITQYECTKKLAAWHHSDIFKSFPSGHSALAMYMSLFLCFYIHKQLVNWPSVYLCSVAQAFLVFFAVYCGCSRMLDHRHHWWDVLSGLVIGVVCSCHSAVLMYKIPPLCHTLFPQPSQCYWSDYERPSLVLISPLDSTNAESQHKVRLEIEETDSRDHNHFTHQSNTTSYN